MCTHVCIHMRMRMHVHVHARVHVHVGHSLCYVGSWPPLHTVAGRLTQKMLAAVPAVSTSDHKPVVCALRVTPSLQVTRTAQPMAMLQCARLRVAQLHTSERPFSRVFCRFYTHPDGLLQRRRALRHAGRQPTSRRAAAYISRGCSLDHVRLVAAWIT